MGFCVAVRLEWAMREASNCRTAMIKTPTLSLYIPNTNAGSPAVRHNKMFRSVIFILLLCSFFSTRAEQFDSQTKTVKIEKKILGIGLKRMTNLKMDYYIIGITDNDNASFYLVTEISDHIYYLDGTSNLYITDPGKILIKFKNGDVVELEAIGSKNGFYTASNNERHVLASDIFGNESVEVIPANEQVIRQYARYIFPLDNNILEKIKNEDITKLRISLQPENKDINFDKNSFNKNLIKQYNEVKERCEKWIKNENTDLMDGF